MFDLSLFRHSISPVKDFTISFEKRQVAEWDIVLDRQIL
jgi:hypothetical protein